jgi:hypothetical protein
MAHNLLHLHKDQEWLPKKNTAVFIVAMKRD